MVFCKENEGDVTRRVVAIFSRFESFLRARRLPRGRAIYVGKWLQSAPDPTLRNDSSIGLFCLAKDPAADRFDSHAQKCKTAEGNERFVIERR